MLRSRCLVCHGKDDNDIQGEFNLASAAGLLSSLHPHNVRLRRAVVDVERAALDSRYPLLYDPQTAGGLLAGELRN